MMSQTRLTCGLIFLKLAICTTNTAFLSVAHKVPLHSTFMEPTSSKASHHIPQALVPKIRMPFIAGMSNRVAMHLRGGAASWASIASPRPANATPANAAPFRTGAQSPSPSSLNHRPPSKRSPAKPVTALRAQSNGNDGAAVDTVAADGQEPVDVDTYYFNSYSHFGIHEEMIKDEVRTQGYRDAFMKNQHLVKGKTVLDVGCGTGILSMFAVQAGAKHVYAVDNSDMADTAREIIRVNGFADKITVIKGDMEKVELPHKVDIIVSEWMGYSLLYEAMLDTVLLARDKWLAEGGIMMPDKANIYVQGIEDAKYKNDKIYFWDDVYGFDMSCIKDAAFSEPLVDNVDYQQICTSTATLWEADLMTITKAELDFDRPFTLTVNRNDYIHALVWHFDVGFTKMHKPLWISTGPRGRPTHWRQTVTYLKDELCVSKGEVFKGELRLRANEINRRHLDYRLKYSFNGTAVNGESGVDHSATHYYRMR